MSEAIEDRGIPPLRAGGGMSSKLRVMVVAFVVLVVMVVFALVVYSKIKNDSARAEQHVIDEPQVVTETRDTDLVAPPTFVQEALDQRAQEDARSMSGAADYAALEDDGAELAPPPSLGGPSAAPRELTEAELEELDRQQRRQRAPVLAFSRSEPSLASGGQRSEPAPAPAPAEDPYQTALMAAIGASANPQPAPVEQRSPLGERLEGEEFEGATATHRTNSSFLVPQGTIGRCVMRTAFNSQLSGFSSCTLSDPIYSADGRFVMAEPGSEIIGTYQTGEVKPGVSRAFVLWTRIRTPHGVSIDLDSPATDGLGRTGIAGKVNNHFWKRFGAGLLLSMVDDAVAVAAGRSNGSDYRATSQSMNDAAAIAVENSVNIPPTITVPAGTVVNIFVARDLDFSAVYTAGLATPSRQ